MNPLHTYEEFRHVGKNLPAPAPAPEGSQERGVLARRGDHGGDGGGDDGDLDRAGGAPHLRGKRGVEARGGGRRREREGVSDLGSVWHSTRQCLLFKLRLPRTPPGPTIASRVSRTLGTVGGGRGEAAPAPAGAGAGAGASRPKVDFSSGKEASRPSRAPANICQSEGNLRGVGLNGARREEARPGRGPTRGGHRN